MRKVDREAKLAALGASPLFQAMTPAELEEILGFASERRAARGEVIFQKGDPGSCVMAVLAGAVRVSAMSMDGKEVTLNTIRAGEIFGEIALLDGKPRSADATATEATLLMVIERRHFVPFMQRHLDLSLRVMAVLCDRLRRTSLALEEIALFDLPSRLARLLLKLADDYGSPFGDGTRLQMKMSDRELSNLVASSRESVNKQLKMWERGGVTDKQGGYLVLRKPAELRALVE